jgi:hypothetical protein
MSRAWIKSSASALLLASGIVCLSACGPEYNRVYVRVGPPAPVYETRVVAPGAGYVWVEGYHRYSGNRYEWVPGHWVRPPRPHAVWVPGHWDHDNRGYFWIEGRWRG